MRKINKTQLGKRFGFPTLVNAVCTRLGGWEDLKLVAEDIAEHGADCGVHGFTYYAETARFATRNRAAISELALRMADDLGEDPIAFVKSFKYLKDDKDITSETIGRCLFGKGGNEIVLNSLAWFALEEVCRCYADFLEEAAGDYARKR